MPTTANYSWPTPADTDLVKDGAEAIRDLGNAVDTTVKAVSDASGLVHINETTIGSGVSSVSLDNVFTSTYNSYKIIFDWAGSTISATATYSMRMRVGGVDATGSNYNRRGTNATGSLTAINAMATSSWQVGQLRTGTTFRSYAICDLFSPADAVATKINHFSYNDDAATPFGLVQQGNHEVNTAYDGFTIFLSTGNMTGGKIRVYGYRN